MNCHGNLTLNPAFLPAALARAARFLPFLKWWPRVNRVTLRADAFAGLTGAVVVLPQGVAFATIAGMPPEYGLYAAMIPAIVAALFGSSWHLVSGPTTAISIVLYSSMSGVAEPGTGEYVQLVLVTTLLVGVFQLAMGLARLGVLVNFISHTVVVGFTAGAGLLIIASQIPHFLGMSLPRGMSFAETLQSVLLDIGNVDLMTASVGVVTLATALIVRHSFPKFPYMLVAMVVGGLYTFLITRVPGLSTHGAVATVTALPGALPELSFPHLNLETLRRTASIAFAVTMLGLTEAVSIGRSIAMRSEQRIDGNQEFIGQGLSNIAGAFFSAYASSGSFNRSGVNYEAGAKTPLSSIIAAFLLVLIVAAVAPLATYLPIPAMAAVLFLVARGLIDVPQMRRILATSREESAVLIVTLVATLTAQLEFAIYIGVMLSLMLYLKRTSRPRVIDVRPDSGGQAGVAGAGEDCPQLRTIRVNGSIFFGAVDHVQGILHDIDHVNPAHLHVLLDATNINFVDIAGAEMLAHEAKRRRRLGGALYLYNTNDDVMSLLRQGGYLDEIGPDNVFSGRDQPMDAIYARLDPAICAGCPARVFANCADTLPDGRPRDGTPTPPRGET
jgi:SulP family sulfate permease